MLKLEKAKELDYSDRKRVLVFKDGVRLGAICATEKDENVWQFCVITTNDLTQGSPVFDLTGEELKELSKVALTHKLP